jgi:hypothetical protein
VVSLEQGLCDQVEESGFNHGLIKSAGFIKLLGETNVTVFIFLGIKVKLSYPCKRPWRPIRF